MTTTKKIAFIGCSHFAVHEQPTQGKGNWTYQLYKKHPQHQYRNYSIGGRGIEHFHWALLHAKIWGADIIFMNRTYVGRWCMQLQLSTDSHLYDYTTTYEEHNWQELNPSFEVLWGNVHAINYAQVGNVLPSFINKILKALNSLESFWRINVAGSDIRQSYEIAWYSNAHKLYNFDNFFLVDWDTQSHGIRTSTTWDMAVSEFLYSRFGPSNNQTLADSGVFISEIDNHLTPFGNTILLNEYILSNPTVKKSIES